jgi:phosphatidylserine/phosphatidylglycerophosphate/cardiolipin synthase-like enzyme
MQAPEGRLHILNESRTCWRIERATRFAALIDSADYFRALLEAFKGARRRIIIVGWDFDPRVRLVPAAPETELGRLLPALVENCSSLRIHLLIWDVAPLFGPSSATAAWLTREWQSHRQIHFRFDGEHPPGASHHEKVVCIDDRLAFVGGIDLTVCRWDTRAHDPAAIERASSTGERYDPVHDVQAVVDGDAAAAIAELARQRWSASGGGFLRPCPRRDVGWPTAAAPWIADVDVGIARTRPRLGERPEAAEVAELNDAALAAATRSVYIESQYLTASRIADRLVELLARDDPPEIVLLVWGDAIGWIERFAMSSNRERILRRLAAADHRDRLRAYRLVCDADDEREILLHSKLIIVDDKFLRIGSSNLSNRSLGVDTECDLAVEGIDTDARAGIRDLESRLLAEHLQQPVTAVREAIADAGRIATIERLNAAHGRLRRYRIDPNDGPLEPLPGTDLLDPGEPIDIDYLGRTLRERLLPD